jgi:Lrp/AsnC family transcriptional regulator, leucine-responsive regulatory protein
MANYDDTDLRLLRALQFDADQSNEALAVKAFTSPATALRRVRGLKAMGAIEQVVATLAPAKFGGVVNAICEITLDRQNAESFAAFEALIEGEPQVTQCYQTHPSVDYTLVLTLARMDDYNELVQRLFTAANNVRNVRSRFATKRTKATFALPI